MTIEPGPAAGRSARPTPVEEIRSFFRSRGKRVVSFAGFGELGYEDESGVDRLLRSILDAWAPRDILVSCGTLLRVGGRDGIARVLAVAHALGIETAGIHPGAALAVQETHQPSPHEEFVFFVDDPSWGGFRGESHELSLTLRTILEVTDELVVIGGGKHAADELEAFIEAGRPVRYFEAEMNHRSTAEWCRRAGVDIQDFRGAAHLVWRTWRAQQTPPPANDEDGGPRSQD